MDLVRVVTLTLAGLMLLMLLIGVIERSGKVTDSDIRYNQTYGILS